MLFFSVIFFLLFFGRLNKGIYIWVCKHRIERYERMLLCHFVTIFLHLLNTQKKTKEQGNVSRIIHIEEKKERESFFLFCCLFRLHQLTHFGCCCRLLELIKQLFKCCRSTENKPICMPNLF